jgi:elongator complex protein 3
LTPTEVVLAAIRNNIRDEEGLRALKIKAAGKTGKLVRNSELVEAYQKLLSQRKIKAQPKFFDLLKKSRIRTLSGVSPVAVLTRDFGCPGKCIFCPTEAKMPKSYLSNEPAVMRAMRAKFDPYEQVRARLQALNACGHETSKIELIVMGGTFSAHPARYQQWFIRRCLEALNTRKSKSNSLADLKTANEKSKHRLVGLTLETRPDYITPAEVKNFLRLGCTRVEIGVQSLENKILKQVKRGHRVEASIRAIKLLKEAGLKIGVHMMPNLPGATPQSDFQMFQQLFTDPDFCPDQVKIYPTVLVKNAELMKWWQEKKWQPYSDAVLTELLVKIKKITPPWVRLTRVIRDIPAESIVAGSKLTNLRQILQQKGVKCCCIRCREIREDKFNASNTKLIQREYKASGGKEIFLSFEDDNKLISMLRLRLPENKDHAFVRELHTYGVELSVAEKEKTAGQHRGFGKKLVAEAERIAKQSGHGVLKIISGVGVRPYYKALGYGLDKEKIYMEKRL